MSPLIWTNSKTVSIEFVHLNCLNILPLGRKAPLLLVAVSQPAHPGVLIVPNRHFLLRQRLHKDLVPLARDVSARKIKPESALHRNAPTQRNREPNL